MYTVLSVSSVIRYVLIFVAHVNCCIFSVKRILGKISLQYWNRIKSSEVWKRLLALRLSVYIKFY